MGSLVAYQTVMYAKAIKTAVAKIWAGAGEGGMGWGTVALGVAGTAGLLSAIAAVQSVDDGIADSSRGPFTITDAYGKMAMTAKGDNLAVSPNINKGGGDDRMLSVLERIVGKNSKCIFRFIKSR
jgi:hypothetical protein